MGLNSAPLGVLGFAVDPTAAAAAAHLGKNDGRKQNGQRPACLEPRIRVAATGSASVFGNRDGT